MVSHGTETAVDYAASSPQSGGNAGALPLLSVIILNYETRGLLKYCLKRLHEISFPFTTEVIVVDNASRDGSATMVRELFPSVQLLALSENRGFAAGNNAGMQRTKGKYLLIMNPDIVVRPGALERLAAFLDRSPRAAAVGPRLSHPDQSLQYSCYRFPHPIIPLYRRTPLGRFGFARRAVAHYCMADTDHARSQPVDWLLGACVMVRREAVERVGFMDERFFLYFEDVDWCRRFWESGYEVWYEPSAELTHFHQRLSAEATGLSTLFSRATRIHILSGVKYFWKWRL